MPPYHNNVLRNVVNEEFCCHYILEHTRLVRTCKASYFFRPVFYRSLFLKVWRWPHSHRPPATKLITAFAFISQRIITVSTYVPQPPNYSTSPTNSIVTSVTSPNLHHKTGFFFLCGKGREGPSLWSRFRQQSKCLYPDWEVDVSEIHLVNWFSLTRLGSAPAPLLDLSSSIFFWGGIIISSVQNRVKAISSDVFGSFKNPATL